jgi:methionine-S-sulfoxide reductase
MFVSPELFFSTRTFHFLPHPTRQYMDDTSCHYEKATFAAGCFWDVEAAFRHIDGVVETIAGYTGGTVTSPTYEQVESGTTGHMHAVGIVFDPAVVTYDELISIFFSIHDPAQDGGQGDYAGPQYRSAIFYHDDAQRIAAIAARDRFAALPEYTGRHILTRVLPAQQFWPAEESHQHFYEKCGQGYGVSRKIWE